MAYLTLYPGDKKWAGIWRSAETVLNYVIIVFGFYVLVAGSYVCLPIPFVVVDTLLILSCVQASVKSIILDFNGQTVFSCVSNGL